MELGLGFEQAFKNSVSLTDDVNVAPDRLLTVASIGLLEDGISRILSEWTQLRKSLARELQLGGRTREKYIKSTNVRIINVKKVDDFQSEIFNWFTQSKGLLATGDLERLLFQTMVRSYKIRLGDGSPRKVACKLMDLYKECLRKSASLRGGETASLIPRCLGRGSRAHGARQKPY